MTLMHLVWTREGSQALIQVAGIYWEVVKNVVLAVLGLRGRLAALKVWIVGHAEALRLLEQARAAHRFDESAFGLMTRKNLYNKLSVRLAV